MKATQICETAGELVGVKRHDTHGEMAVNFANIARLWNGWWEIRRRQWEKAGYPISGPVDLFRVTDVGDLLELMKIARRYTGAHNLDDYIDAAGYAACTGELASAREDV